ncbi:MAG: hypothetical protein P8X96_09440 [Desulfobacteraceae bacterium]|jgi:hypothetical protein
MLRDVRRIRTFLAYKGFQWEPLVNAGEADERPGDFTASRMNDACLVGTILSIGQERPYDGSPIQVVVDEGERAGRLVGLRDRLETAVHPLCKAGAEAGLPLVVVLVNHDPHWRFEDLSVVLEDKSASALPSVDLFIWFDDFRNDRMLFRRTNPAAYESLFSWFHVA